MYPLPGQQGDGIAVDRDLPNTQTDRLATKAGSDWQTGLRFSHPAGLRICGRVFLAWMSKARHKATAKPEVLGRKAPKKQGPRP